MGLLTEPGQVDLAFTAVSNKTYLIQFRDSLTSGAWQTLIDVPADSFTRQYTISDSFGASQRSRFYRLQLTP